jgi:hypothetical protein
VSIRIIINIICLYLFILIMGKPHKQTHNQHHEKETHKDKVRVEQTDPLAEIEVPKEKYASTTITVANLILLPAFIFAAYIIVKFILHAQYEKFENPFVRKITAHYPSEWSFEGKISFLVGSFFYAALFLFGCVTFNMLLRALLSKPNPFNDEDPHIISTINRVIQNTIEQSFIFFPLLAHFVLNVSTEKDSKQAFLFVLIFLAGRAIFLVGYLFLLVSKLIGIRVVGFVLNLTVNILLVVKFIGCQHLEKVVFGLLA